MKRDVDSLFLTWKNDKNRKPLLVRGARQVGKTFSIRELGKSFKYFLEVNFEEEKRIGDFFKNSLNPATICQKLSAYFATPVVNGETLLFFDEIQACPEAITSLRFFYEKMPDLHLIAAGSLLEFAIAEIPSQGVGRINSAYMYPLSFDEFLRVQGEGELLKMKNSVGSQQPLDNIFHHKLIDHLKIFYLIGGMPEVVAEYIKTKNIVSCHKIINDLLETLRDDFAKYKKRSPVQRLKEVFDSITFQSGNKFKYSNIDSQSAHNALKEALDLIIQAGLAYKIYHSSAQGLPLGAQIKLNKFKVILLDPGLHQQILGLKMADIISAQDLAVINQGNIAEVFVGTEIIKYSSSYSKQQLYYWHKEKRGSNAEVDYLIQKGNKIIPLEVKSGTRGQMQSMKIFLREHQNYTPKGIRLSLENFNQASRIDTYPLYAISKILK